MSKMSDTKVYLNIARALQICLVLTIWTTNTAVDVCDENQYWDATQERCSECEGICRVYDRTIDKDCQCICFPDTIMCRPSLELNPLELATKSDAYPHQIWLIVLSVLLTVNVLGLILWHFYKDNILPFLFLVKTLGVILWNLEKRKRDRPVQTVKNSNIMENENKRLLLQKGENNRQEQR